MKGIVKTVTAVLSISMLASLASCSLFDKSKEECIGVGDEFVESALAREIDDCIDVCIDDDAQILRDYNNGTLITVDYEILDAIIENATFEADEKSADCSKKDGVGSIDYIISVPDFEAAMDEEPEDKDEFIDILANTEETKEYIVTLEFEFDDEEWFISNPEDFKEDFYDKVSDNDIQFVNYEELVNCVAWYNDSNEGIELYIVAIDEDFVFEFYYVVTYNTEVVYTRPSSLGNFYEEYNSSYSPSINDFTNGIIVLDEDANKWGLELRLYLHENPSCIKATHNRVYRKEYAYRVNDVDVIKEMFNLGYRIGLN